MSAEELPQHRPWEPVHVCSISEAGAILARKLPWRHHHGALLATVERLWPEAGALVLVCSTGIAVRAVAPLLHSKHTDPAVLCLDDAGLHAVVLLGGHSRAANELARMLSALSGAEAVLSTATEISGRPGLDTLPGLVAEGDLAGVSRRWLDGETLHVARDQGLGAWPLPAALAGGTEPSFPLPAPTSPSPAPTSPSLAPTSPSLAPTASPVPASGAPAVILSDRLVAPGPGRVLLRPRSLALGVGASANADPRSLQDLLAEVLAHAGLHPASIGVIATLDRKATEPAIAVLSRHLGVSVRGYPAAALAEIAVPNPSPVVLEAVGTASVAEAAALAAAGQGAQLVVQKRASSDATVALARRLRPEGRLVVVGLGPGSPTLRTPAASAAVAHAEVLIGYEGYLDHVADLISPRQEVLRFPIGGEGPRCREALRRAADGASVALVCSGDPGVYAMASLVCEMAPSMGDPPVEVVPGVTASLAAAALLGAPLGHDHAAISLSDLLTPWAVIESRLHAAAEGDFVTSLYNPRSARRSTQLPRALEILGGHRPTSTPAAVVTNAGRPGEEVLRCTLATLDPEWATMSSLVVVGSSSTRWVGDRMVTPRGYLPSSDAPEGEPA